MTLRENTRQNVGGPDLQRVLAVFAVLLGALLPFHRPYFAHLLDTWGPLSWVVPIVGGVAALDTAVYAWRGMWRTSSAAVLFVCAALLLLAVLAWRLS